MNITLLFFPTRRSSDLEKLRGDQWNRPAEQRLTWAGRSKYVKPSKIQVSTTSSRSRTFRIELETTEGPRDSVLRSEEHTSELQSPCNLVCRLLLEKKKR